MPNLLVRLSDAQHASLEAYRARRGLRSLNAAVLEAIAVAAGLIDTPVSGIEVELPVYTGPKVIKGVVTKRQPVDVPAPIPPGLKAVRQKVVEAIAELDEIASPLSPVQIGPTKRPPGSLQKASKR